MAIMNVHFDLAAYLIEAGADIDKWDLYGRTPLYMAADMNTLPVMGNGAMVVLPSMDKLTGLDIAKMLLAKGADPNIQLKRRPPYRNVPQDRGGDVDLVDGRDAAAARCACRRRADGRAAAEERRARRPAEQPRRHAADGGRRRGIRSARHARPQSDGRGRARDDAAARRRGRGRQRADAHGAEGRRRGGAARDQPATGRLQLRLPRPAGAEPARRFRIAPRCTAPR